MTEYLDPEELETIEHIFDTSYGYIKHHSMPNAGGIDDQPTIWYEGIKLVEIERDNYERKEIEAESKRK